MIEVLLEHGADIEGASPDGRTALMIAAMFNRVELVEYLIGHGANPDARDANGFSARDAAEKMGAPDTVARLVAATEARARPVRRLSRARAGARTSMNGVPAGTLPTTSHISIRPGSTAAI